MSKLSEEQIKEIISRRFTLFDKITKEAFKDEIDSTATFSYKLNSLGHSIVTNNFMIYKAQQLAEGNKEFRMYRKGQADYFIIRDEKDGLEIHGKFKKLRPSLLSSNIPTQTVLRFLQQEPLQYELDFMPERVNIIVGYLPNKDRTEMKAFITCPSDEKHLAWILPIPENGIEEQVDKFIPSVSPIVEPVKRVFPTAAKIKKEANETKR